MKNNFLVVRLHSSFLTVAVDVAGLSRVCQPSPFTAIDVWVTIQALTHLVTDHVHQPLKHSLNKQNITPSRRIKPSDVFRVCSIVFIGFIKVLSFKSRENEIGKHSPLPTLTLIFSLADVSKNWSPRLSASCFPLSYEITLSSSMSLLFPTKMTWALSQL